MRDARGLSENPHSPADEATRSEARHRFGRAITMPANLATSRTLMRRLKRPPRDAPGTQG
jgi:hypothetical protein